jgi:coenzyme F420-0:L-glutamate ligase / coenzyme F420-1:gamma-L-glutamate ligase
MSLVLTPVNHIPLIEPGNDISEEIIAALQKSQIQMKEGDILVLAQKIVSKAEDRLVNLNTVQASEKAFELAGVTGKDARFIELVLRESSRVLRSRFGTIIVEHNNGFVCANAGIDHSNVKGPWGDDADWVLLLPENADRSAGQIKAKIDAHYGIACGVLIIDSHGRAWRNGVVGCAIGLAGLPGLVDLRGTRDMFGFKLQVTQVCAADELAAAASLVMGQAAEGTPVVHVSGFPYPLREGCMQELIRPPELDLFR